MGSLFYLGEIWSDQVENSLGVTILMLSKWLGKCLVLPMMM